MRALATTRLQRRGSLHSTARADDIQVASSGQHEPITVAADWCTHWQEGVYDVWHLRGNCYLNQGLTYARGPEAVLWVDARNYPRQPITVIAYFEAGASEQRRRRLRQPSRRRGKERRAGKAAQPDVVPADGDHGAAASGSCRRPRPPPVEKPAIYARGLEQFNPDRRRQLLLAQYNEFAPAPAGGDALPPGMRRVHACSRAATRRRSSSGRRIGDGQQAVIISGGVRLLIEGLPTTGVPAQFGPLGVGRHLDRSRGGLGLGRRRAQRRRGHADPGRAA